jgi:hypothetical protein
MGWHTSTQVPQQLELPPREPLMRGEIYIAATDASRGCDPGEIASR